MRALNGIRALACAALLFAGVATAQDIAYPKRANIEVTVLFPAGSSADVTARLLAQGIAKNLGANVIVVNRPGAGGAIGYKYVASQKPDGYNLVWNSNSISTTYHSGQLAIDYRAFDPVARVLVESPLLAVRGEARWKTLAEFISDAKARGAAAITWPFAGSRDAGAVRTGAGPLRHGAGGQERTKQLC